MAIQTRTRSNTVSGPHALSLKVLHLSRPSLATQTRLPHDSTTSSGFGIPSNASLAYPSGDKSSSFPLTPLLTLPSAFGAAYVGEAFRCTLCVNNELEDGPEQRKSISAVKIQAELQTPTKQQGSLLPLEGADEEGEAVKQGIIKPGETLQRTLRHELKDEGQHVLAVTVTYTETLHDTSGEVATAGRVRTFRKLYQFVSQQSLAVRSKVTERKGQSMGGPRQWILEAQLENVGEASVVLERVWMKDRDGIHSKSVSEGDKMKEEPVLKPQDVKQVMFVLEEEAAPEDRTSRVPLGQLNIDWRSAMGEKGSLTTGWLASRGG